jgi:hypothetical protein
MVTTLMGLMLSVDEDLALGSLRLINALLRRLEDALKAICDRASQDNALWGKTQVARRW